MPVFLQFRLWLTQGPVRERVVAAVAALIAIVLLVLASLPLTDDGDDASTVAATGPDSPAGQEATTAADATIDPVVASGATGGPAASGATTSGGTSASGPRATVPTAPGAAAPRTGAVAAAACTEALTASAPGISAKEVLVGVSIVNLVGPVGNAAFDIRPDLHEAADAVVDDINKSGGVACGRKLVIKKYAVNPIDQNDQQAKCLQMVQDKVFAVLDSAGYVRPVARACFVQNKLPHQLSVVATEAESTKGYPFIYGLPVTSERAARNGVLGLAELGFFATPKFQKLGLLTDACDPSVAAEIERNLAKVGVKPNQISKFTLNCALIGSPTEISQAVVQHRSSGATHVFLAASLSNGQRYTQLAAQQDFRPAYGVSDYGTYTSSAGSWDPSFNGATGVTTTHGGELNSGIRSAELTACDRILRAHGLAPIVTEKEDGSAGLMCDQFSLFRRAIDRVGANPSRQTFIDAGVSRVGEFKAALMSDGLFNRHRKVVGGDFRRPVRYDGACRCWKLRDRNFKPAF